MYSKVLEKPVDVTAGGFVHLEDSTPVFKALCLEYKEEEVKDIYALMVPAVVNNSLSAHKIYLLITQDKSIVVTDIEQLLNLFDNEEL